MKALSRRRAMSILDALIATPALRGIAHAQRPVPLLAILEPDPAAGPQGGERYFREALVKLGWVEGRTIRVEIRHGEWRVDHTAAMARELVALRPDVFYSGWRLFIAVLLPGALPHTRLRLDLGYALIVAVAVEIVAASRGLGALSWLSWQVLKVEDMYATFFVIAILSGALSYGLAAVRDVGVETYTRFSVRGRPFPQASGGRMVRADRGYRFMFDDAAR